MATVTTTAPTTASITVLTQNGVIELTPEQASHPRFIAGMELGKKATGIAAALSALPSTERTEAF